MPSNPLYSVPTIDANTSSLSDNELLNFNGNCPDQTLLNQQHPCPNKSLRDTTKLS